MLPVHTTTAKHPGKVVMTGTIADYGKDVATNAQGKPTAQGGYRKLELKKGTILVDVAALTKAVGQAFSDASFDTTTCSVSVTIATPVTITIVSGTKAYAGVTGTLAMTGSYALIAPRTKSGACTTKTTARPLITFAAFTGTGTVALP